MQGKKPRLLFDQKPQSSLEAGPELNRINLPAKVREWCAKPETNTGTQKYARGRRLQQPE